MLKVLFVCGKNTWRSPTAEQVFCGHPGIECSSAGLSHDAEVIVSVDLVVCLGIPDKSNPTPKDHARLEAYRQVRTILLDTLAAR